VIPQSIYIQIHQTLLGELLLGECDGKICLLDYLHRKQRVAIDKRVQSALHAQYVVRETSLLNVAKREIDEYLCGGRQYFDLPILMAGTDFQQTVWSSLQNIPYGETASYLQIASQIGKPTAVRAVANANGANCINLIIPCHRVIGRDGTLVGYGGGLENKKMLLGIESNNRKTESLLF